MTDIVERQQADIDKLMSERDGWLQEIERLRAADIKLRNRIRKFALLWRVPQADVDRALETKP